jgi:enoyl-CoA hydratase/carnithine racemase
VAFKNLEYVVRERIAEITLTRAPANAIDHGPIEDLNNAYCQAKADKGVRAVILTSAFTRAFSIGDLAMICGKRGLDLRRYLQKLYFEMHDLQYRMGKPTIAALTGPARAAGVTLAVSCDCIVAADTASLAYPEILVGVIPAMHFVHLPRQIGRHKAFGLLFSGKPISTEVAAGHGAGARRLHARQRLRVSPRDREHGRDDLQHHETDDAQEEAGRLQRKAAAALVGTPGKTATEALQLGFGRLHTV